MNDNVYLNLFKFVLTFEGLQNIFKMSTYRPRRSRIYGANYDLSEQYYKKALQDIDDKYKPKRSSILQSSRISPSLDTWNPKETYSPRENVSDSFSRKNLRDNSFRDFEDKFDDEFQPVRDIKSRIRLSLGRTDFHDDFADTSDYLRNAEKSLVENDMQDFRTSSIRQVKVRSENILQDDSYASEASSRAKATKARLADLESEMLDITEKQNERAKRNSHLKKLLAGNDDLWIE